MLNRTSTKKPVRIFCCLLAALMAAALLPYGARTARAATALPIVLEATSFDSNNTNSSDTSNSLLRTSGDATPVGGVLRLAQAVGNQKGTAVRRSRIKLNGGFSTYFQFYMWGGNQADGLCFVIYKASSDTPQIGNYGSGLGYSGIPNSVGVEFDIYKNSGPEYGYSYSDPDNHHAAICVNGDNDHNASTTGDTNTTTVSASEIYGSVINVWVDYSTTGDISVTFGTSTDRASNTYTMSRNVGTFLNDQDVLVGFSASTGGNYANHDIQKWYFSNHYVSGGLSSTAGTYTQAASSVAISLSPSATNPVTASITLKDGSGNAMANQSAQIYIDDVLQTTVDTGASGTYNYTIPGLSPGSHTLKTVDTAGGTMSTASFTVTMPALTADSTSNDVDHDITVTYPSNSMYQSKITSVSFGGTALTSGQYDLGDGTITIHRDAIPSHAPGSYTVAVQATGYSNNTVTQPITAGAAVSMTVTQQPVPGASSGAAFATQPKVTLYDDYSNVCSTGPSASAAVAAAPTSLSDGSAWTLGGTASVSASAGVVSYSGLTCTQVSYGTDGKGGITFASGGLTAASSLFSLPKITASGLTADSTNNDVDHDITVTYPVNNAYKGCITGVTLDGTPLSAGDYTLEDGAITIKASAIPNMPGVHTIAVQASGYTDTSVAQTVTAGQAVSMTVTQQPVPSTSNGAAFTTQPKVTLYDQYNNVCSTGPSANATVAAAPTALGDGSFWTPGGTASVQAVAGVVTYSGLTCTQVSYGTGGKGSIAFTSGGMIAVSDLFPLPKIIAPALTADITDNDVDHDITVTYPADDSYKGRITGVTLDGTPVSAGGYTLENGAVTVKASAIPGHAPGSYTVAVLASGYTDTSVSQPITAGLATSMTVTQQPVPGANGAAFTTQPKVTLYDQYSNVCATGPSASAIVAAAPTSLSDGSAWTQGGMASVQATAGVVTYSGLTCTQVTYGTGGKGSITFTSGSLTAVSSLFPLPKIVAPVLTADSTDNDVDHAIEITFPVNPAYEGLVTGVTCNSQPLQQGTDYTITSGKLTLLPSGGNTALRSAGTWDIVLSATGYFDASVSQPIVAVKPTVTTKTGIATTQTEGKASGAIVSDGGAPITERGFVYSTTANPTVDSGTKALSADTTDTFASKLAKLNAGATYYIRAYAVNSVGVSYGEELKFITPAFVTSPPAQVSTGEPAGTLFHGMTLSASVQPNYGDVITMRGFVYSATNTSPEYGDKDAQEVGAGNGAGSYTATLTDLVPGATYYVRAYVSGNAGFSYGKVMRFTIPLGDGVAGIPKTGDGAGIPFLALGAGLALLAGALLRKSRKRG